MRPSRAARVRRPDRQAADQGLSTGSWSSPSKDPTLPERRAPTGHEQPRRRVHGFFDHERQRAPAVSQADQEPPALRTTRIAHQNVTVTGQLDRLPEGNTPRGELPGRTLGRNELVDNIGHERWSIGAPGRSRAEVAPD